MDSKPELINCQPGEVEEVRLTIDGMTVEDAREFLKKLDDALDEN